MTPTERRFTAYRAWCIRQRDAITSARSAAFYLACSVVAHLHGDHLVAMAFAAWFGALVLTTVAHALLDGKGSP